MVRQKPSERSAPDRRTSRIRTLQRRFDFHLGEAIRAAVEGSHDKAATHSGTALSISRELRADERDQQRHQARLAAALCNHARYGSTPMQTIALLTESAGLYAALAKADPAVYEVARIEVLTRIALASDSAGSTGDAISLLREVVRMYIEAPAADLAERDLGLARARFHLGRCLLKTGSEADGTGGNRRRPRPRRTCLGPAAPRGMGTRLARHDPWLRAVRRAGLGGGRRSVDDAARRRRPLGGRGRRRLRGCPDVRRPGGAWR